MEPGKSRWAVLSVLIGKEIRVFSKFKHLTQSLIPVLQLLVRTCTSRNQTVTAVFFSPGSGCHGMT